MAIPWGDLHPDCERIAQLMRDGEFDFRTEFTEQHRQLLHKCAEELIRSGQFGFHLEATSAANDVAAAAARIDTDKPPPLSVPPRGINTVERLKLLEKDDSPLWIMLAVQLVRVLERKKKQEGGPRIDERAHQEERKALEQNGAEAPQQPAIPKRKLNSLSDEAGDAIQATTPDPESPVPEIVADYRLRLKEVREAFATENQKKAFDYYLKVKGCSLRDSVTTDPTTMNPADAPGNWNVEGIQKELRLRTETDARILKREVETALQKKLKDLRNAGGAGT